MPLFVPLSLACLTLQEPSAPPLAPWRLEGTVTIEGHYAKPEEVRRYRASVEHVIAPSGATEAVAWTTWWTDADAPRSTTRVVRTGDGTWLERDGRATRAEDRDELRHAEALLALGARTTEPVVERPFTHGRLGDVADVLRRTFDGDAGAAPTRLSAVIHDAGVVLTFELARVADEAASLESLREAHARLLHPPREAAPRDPRRAATVQVRELRPGVHEALVPAYDSRALVLTIGGELAVVQAPGDAWTGDALVDALHHALPERPIRWVVPTHHHPHSLGGVRAFVAVGAKVVTTPGNEAYVRKLLRAPFTQRPDRLAQLGARSKEPELVLVRGSLRLGAGDEAVDVLDLGARSRHTDEHLVVHVPRAGLLFHGDLGWHPDGAGGVRVGSRAAGLLEAIEAPPGGGASLRVSEVLQSWPVNDVPATLTPAELRAALQPR